MRVLAAYFYKWGDCVGWGNVAADFEMYPPNEKDIRELEKKIAEENSCPKCGSRRTQKRRKMTRRRCMDYGNRFYD